METVGFSFPACQSLIEKHRQLFLHDKICISQDHGNKKLLLKMCLGVRPGQVTPIPAEEFLTSPELWAVRNPSPGWRSRSSALLVVAALPHGVFVGSSRACSLFCNKWGRIWGRIGAGFGAGIEQQLGQDLGQGLGERLGQDWGRIGARFGIGLG